MMYPRLKLARNLLTPDGVIVIHIDEHEHANLEKLLNELGTVAWLAGLRANQTEHRASLPRVGMQNGRVKLHPILQWSEEDVDAYMERHDLPYHPLYAEGYRSIGDTHSTLPTTADMDPRDGRLLGKKKECGLHLPLTPAQNQSLKSSGL